MEKKICSKCGVEKEVCDFNKRTNRKGIKELRKYCKSCHNKISTEFNKKNPDKYEKYRLKWYSNNSKRLIEKNRMRRNTDLIYKLRISIRGRLRHALKNMSEKGGTIGLLGIDIKNFKVYLESKFSEGMTWENYGLQGWHIDHIIPLSSAKDEKELISLCHYTNLQPLWAIDNYKKSNKILI